MPTTREELQSIPKEWFDSQVNLIVSSIVQDIKFAARSRTYFEHDVLARTNKTGVYSTSPRITLEDVLEGLKRELPDCSVAIHRRDDPGMGILKLVIRVDWGNPT